MLEGSFQESSLGWRIAQLQRRVTEWIELRLSPPEVDTPDWSPNWTIPEWITKVIFWGILSILAVWLLWQLYLALQPYWRQWRSQNWQRMERAKPAVATEHSLSYWLKQAAELQQAGNYTEACRALYMAMLQRLHETQVISNQTSRTDGEYLQLVEELPQPRPYQLLLRTHERICFAGATMTAEVFQRCRRAYEEIVKP